MSYVRWSPTSDVYIYDDVAGGITCCGCFLSDQGPKEVSFNCQTWEQMQAHLREHIAAGHAVPEHLMEVLPDGCERIGLCGC